MVEIGCRDAQTNTILNFPGSLVQSLYVNISRTTTLPSYSSICFLNASWNRLEQGPPLVKTNCGLVHVTANLLFHILRTVLHVFYRLARFNSSSRRYFNSSPILQAGCNYSLCSPNQTLTGWGMTSHWEAIKLKLIHKNSTYPLYPLKTEILAVGTLTSHQQLSPHYDQHQLPTPPWSTGPDRPVEFSSLSSPSQVQSPLLWFWQPPAALTFLFQPSPLSDFWVYDSFLSFCYEHICQFYMEASPKATLPKVAPVPNSPAASSY